MKSYEKYRTIPKPSPMKKITVTVSKNGETTIETEGFVGASCQEATQPLEERLGVTTSDVPKEELYQSDFHYIKEE